MKIKKATVLTNCTEDPQWRVKLQCAGVWEESELIPALNTPYLDKGDEVLVLMEDIYNPVILGRICNQPQTSVNKNSDGPIVFQAVKEDNWIVARLLESDIKIITSKGTEVTVSLEGIEIKTKTTKNMSDESMTNETKDYQLKASSSIKIEGGTVNVKGSTVTIEGKTDFKNPIGPPDGQGPLCGIPNCLFSGAPHSAKSTS